MTTPGTPGEVIARAAQRLTQQREATRVLAAEVAAKRAGPDQATTPPSPDGGA